MSDSSPEFDLGELLEYDEIEYVVDCVESSDFESHELLQAGTTAEQGIPLNIELLESMCQSETKHGTVSALALSTNDTTKPNPLQMKQTDFIKAPEIFLRIDNNDHDATKANKMTAHTTHDSSLASVSSSSASLVQSTSSKKLLLCDIKTDSFESIEGPDSNGRQIDIDFANELQYENEFFDPNVDDVGNNFSVEPSASSYLTSHENDDNEQLLLEGIHFTCKLFYVVCSCYSVIAFLLICLAFCFFIISHFVHEDYWLIFSVDTSSI